MKINIQLAALALAFSAFSTSVWAREEIGKTRQNPGTNNQRGMVGNQTLDNSCSPGTAKTDLDLNNVRTKILTGGDMWWDFISAQYEIPKGGKANSIFAGSLWIGGLDAGGQLKVAAQTYRQNGNDFWPGPLDTINVSTTGDQCQKYDQHFKIFQSDVARFNGWFLHPSDPQYAGYSVPTSITNWPWTGDPSKNQARYLAPFFDNNNDGIYNPGDGDYPGYDLTGNLACGWKLYGDETLWWVFNDKGNIHTETNAQAIGLEIQAEAFAFSTNDDINNMTFYKYKIINRSTYAMNKTWFGQWIDMDLGKYDDDYVGCDVSRGLGYTYNGATCDGTGTVGQYGCQPPACGCDFFQGPLADAHDGIDNNRNGVIDEPNEQIIMSQFIYYNNDFNPVNGNPRTGTQYYNYLKGYWGDGSHMTYGGNGVSSGVPCQFMFPGNSDPTGWGTNRVPQPAWSEATAGNTPGDRRFMQSAGSFTLQPGAVNYITTGIVWARATSGGPLGSVSLLRLVDDKAQALFDNCFKVLNGPAAPDVAVQELDREIILRLSNQPAPVSNNYLESYYEIDPQIQAIDTFHTSVALQDSFKFEGYQIFQLHDAQVSANDLDNVDKARLIAECDVKNGVSRIVNYVPNNNLGGTVPQEMVVGADAGISHSFNITSDLFSQIAGNKLVNQKTYYYMAVAYGYNNYIPYAQDVAFQPAQPFLPSLVGQRLPYKRGRQNIKIYSAIPHIPAPQGGGTIINGAYGTGPVITRIDGNGNGGNAVDLTDASVAAILNSTAPVSRMEQVQYKGGAGPVNVKVVDPLNVPSANFTLKIKGTAAAGTMSPYSSWVLTNNTTGDSVVSDKSLAIYNEQTLTNVKSIMPNWGISVTITQPVGFSYTSGDVRYDFISGSMTFSDNTKNWLTGIPDADGYTDFNWIRGGTTTASSTTTCDAAFNSVKGSVDYLDASEQYSKVLGGIWGPYRMCAFNQTIGGNLCNHNGPAWDQFNALTKMSQLPSIDIVLTNDQSKWSRCPVFELADLPGLAQGGASKLDLRKATSVDKYGNPNGSIDYPTGMGYFPGYAINVETGERLNIAFGEDSWLTAFHGRDMIWNPTTDMVDQFGNNVWGGKHYIYVFNHNGKYVVRDGTTGNLNMPAYDAGAYIHDKISSGNPTDKRNVFKDCAWVGIPMLAPGQSLLSTPVTIKIRVTRPYMTYLNTASDSATVIPFGARPVYKFSTDPIKTVNNDGKTAKDALALINIVPNPYYAYSTYETSQLDNRVKLTNLPGKCTISIFTISGTLVRQFKKDNELSFQDWDIKNTAGIPCASGMYIIHVDVPGVGEKIIKWFGVARPIDLDSF
ncbi:MAG: T9SS C-terminal target domain-containing protein [Bacteroidia bacterium]